MFLYFSALYLFLSPPSPPPPSPNRHRPRPLFPKHCLRNTREAHMQHTHSLSLFSAIPRRRLFSSSESMEPPIPCHLHTHTPSHPARSRLASIRDQGFPSVSLLRRRSECARLGWGGVVGLTSAYSVMQPPSMPAHQGAKKQRPTPSASSELLGWDFACPLPCLFSPPGATISS